MSIQFNTTTNLAYPFFDSTPEDITRLVFSSMKGEKNLVPSIEEDQTIMATARVCKSWQNNLVLKEIREEAATRLWKRIVHEELKFNWSYPLSLQDIFQKNRQSIHKLPILDVSFSENQPIDSLNLENMSYPIMKFKHHDGRVAIALKIHGRFILSDQIKTCYIAQGGIKGSLTFLFDCYKERGFQSLKEDLKQLWDYSKPCSDVLILYKKDQDPASQDWTYTWANKNDTIESLYLSRHFRKDQPYYLTFTPDEYLPLNPNLRHINHPTLNETGLSALLRGTDPDFSLYERSNINDPFDRNFIVAALVGAVIGQLIHSYLIAEYSS